MQGIRAGGSTGSKMSFYCGCVFSVVGVIFIITFLLVMSHWETVVINGRGAVWLIPVAFGLMSVIMLVIGFFLLIASTKNQSGHCEGVCRQKQRIPRLLCGRGQHPAPRSAALRRTNETDIFQSQKDSGISEHSPVPFSTDRVRDSQQSACAVRRPPAV